MGIRRYTIWAPDAIPQEERKFRSIKRVWLPFVDVLLILGGLVAKRYGVPIIDEFFTDEQVAAWGSALATAALGCLIGVSFPKLWVLEIVSKILVISLVFVFLISLLLLTQEGDAGRGFTAVFSFVALVPLFIRLSILGSEWGDRRQVDRAIDERLRDRAL